MPDARVTIRPLRGAGAEAVARFLERHWGSLVQVVHGTVFRFYQRRGFRLAALRPGAVSAARAVKPEIPQAGEHGIPLRDEIDLVRPA